MQHEDAIMLKSALIVLFISFIMGMTACGAVSSTATITLAATAEPELIVTEVVSAEPIGDAERGQQIFTRGLDEAPPCSTCHVQSGLETRMFQLAPSLISVGERAATRIEGMNAEEYLHHSIVAPSEYVVSGYRAMMYGNYADHFSDKDIADLVAYLLTL